MNRLALTHARIIWREKRIGKRNRAGPLSGGGDPQGAFGSIDGERNAEPDQSREKAASMASTQIETERRGSDDAQSRLAADSLAPVRRQSLLDRLDSDHAKL
jgi:hypothetical protein